jgi:uncharacterized repeat protein (TIGR02543 family)
MSKFRVITAAFALVVGMISPTWAADKVGSLSGSRDGTTGLITATWSVSTIANLTGYKVVVDAAGSGKAVSQFRTPGSVTSAKICFPFTGNTKLLVSPTTTTVTNPTYANTNSPGGNWVVYDFGALGSVSSACTSNSSTTYDYSISFDGNNSTSGTMTSISGNDFSASLPVNSFSRTGYSFNGWSTTRTGVGGTSYTDEQIITLNANLSTTLYAQWTCDQTRILRYFANRATSGTLPVTGNQTVCQSESVTLSANTGTLARTGFTWSGWSTSELGSGTNYAAGDPFTIPSRNTALYALWIPTNTKTQVVYNGNKADSGASPVLSEQTPGTIITIPGNTGNLVKTGKCFGGWNLKPNGSGTNYALNDPYTHTKTKKVVLYAKWSNCP